MKVHLISKQALEEFIEGNARSRSSFEIWYSLIKMADWTVSMDILETFNSADLLGNGSERVVFNVGGNSYRIICKYHFGTSRIHLFIKWIGTHAEYSKLCKEGRQYEICMY